MRRQDAPMLEVGERVGVAERVYRVALVNSCRARLELCGGERVVREFQAFGQTIAFATWDGPRSLDVSPHSILPRA